MATKGTTGLLEDIFSDMAANPIIGCRSSEAERPPETRVVRNHASKRLTWPVKSNGRHVRITFIFIKQNGHGSAI